MPAHEEKMEESEQEKYLGDILLNNAKMTKTVEDRRAKGYGFVSQILAIYQKYHLVNTKYKWGCI